MTMIMVTENGPHSAEYWARTTAEQIVQGSGATEIRDALIGVLTPHYERVQVSERELLEDDSERLADPLDAHEFTLRGAVSDVMDVANASASSAHFKQKHVQEYVSRLIAQHLSTATEVERSWHADRNPNDPVVRAYRAAKRKHAPGQIHNHIDNYRAKRKA